MSKAAKEAPEKPLFSIETEQSVIGSCLRDNGLLDVIQSDLEPDTFYDPFHARIYSTMLEARDGHILTPSTLFHLMADDESWTEVGGQEYLEAMRLVGGDGAPIRQYVAILREFKLKRLAIQDLDDALWMLRHTARPVAKAIASVVVVADMAAQSEARARPVMAEDIGRRVMAKMEAAARGEKIPSITTGLKLLDDKIGGLQAADLMVIPGRSGMGKSSLLAGICLRAAMAGHPVLLFELEMTADQLIQRCIADIDYDDATNPISYSRFRYGNLTVEQMDRAHRAATYLNNMPFEICDVGDLTAEDIGARARAFKAKHAHLVDERGKPLLGLIGLDYMQRVQPSVHRDRSREQEVAHVARSLKTLAKAMGWPVAALAQLLNKGGDPRQANTEQIPTLAAIRETGQIEMEADIIVAPHRKAWFLRKQKPDSPEGSPEFEQWRGEYRACKNLLRLYGLKMRHGGEFDLDLWCSMAASAIRDEEPRINAREEARNARDLLEGY